MPDPLIYLDHAATSPVSPARAGQLGRDLLELGWNTGTRYALGLTAKKALEACRGHMAGILACDPEAVIFTSGGTESNNIGLHACCTQQQGGGILWHSATTHPSLAGPVGGLLATWDVHTMPCTAWGRIDTALLGDLPAPDVVVLEWVNNEIGFVQPVADVLAAAVALNENARVLIDGAQGFGKLPLPDLRSVAAFSFAGHKIGAPVGIGGLMLNPRLKPAPLTVGGGQERGLRPGTVALPLIRALCGALDDMLAQDRAGFDFPAFDDDPIPAVVRHPDGVYSPCITVLDVSPVEGEVLQHHLEEQGIYLGAGSACSASKKGLSPVHRAVGLDAQRSRCTLRWSTVPGQSRDDLDRAWRTLVMQWRELKRFF